MVQTQAPAHIRQVYHSAVVISTYPEDTIEFIGANVLDQHPFIVMPLLKNGNARDYVPAHRDFDIIRLVCVASMANKHYPDLNNPALSRLFGFGIPTFRGCCTW
jgi:hypothetical protein